MAVHAWNGLFRKSQHPKTDAKNTAAAKISESEFDSGAGDRSQPGVLSSTPVAIFEPIKLLDGCMLATFPQIEDE